MESPRLYMFQIISAIETDYRRFIKTFIYPTLEDEELLSQEARSNLVFRAKKDGQKVSDDLDLVDFLDYGDAYSVVRRYLAYLPDAVVNQVKANSESLDKSLSVRNRVFHNRPLIDGDFFCIEKLAEKLYEHRKHWQQLGLVVRKIREDPDYLNTSFKGFVDEEECSSIVHNLPLADFDATGFIGREKELTDVLSLLRGPDRIVSIIGEGGVGKSALMLKAAYELVDAQNCPFETIIWISTKSAYFTSEGIVRIASTIKGLDGTIDSINDFCAEAAGDMDSGILGLVEYFRISPTLLILDNVENVIDQKYIQFLSSVKEYVKIGVTSRIGIGKMDMPINIKGLDRNAALRLINELIRVRKCEPLTKAGAKRLNQVIKQLDFNPLAIKWVVGYVSSGGKLESALSNKNDLLNYCMSDVYDKLSGPDKQILHVLRIIRKASSEATLCYYSELEPFVVRGALARLSNNSFIRCSQGEDSDTVFEIGKLAFQYLSASQIVPPELAKSCAFKTNHLNQLSLDDRPIDSKSMFRIESIQKKGTSHIVPTRLLYDALRLLRAKNNQALQKIAEAKNISPGFPEVYCIEGFVKSKMSDVVGAVEAYEMGLEVDPNSDRIKFFFAGQLLYDFNDSERAIQLLESIQNYSDSADVMLSLSKAYGFSGKYDIAIDIVKKVYEQHSSDLKYKKLAIMNELSFRGDKAGDCLKIDKDFKGAFSEVEIALDEFKKKGGLSIVDDRIVKKLSRVLFHANTANIHDRSLKDRYIRILENYRGIWENSDDSQIFYEVLEGTSGGALDQSEKMTGNIVKYNEDRGFGFIENDGATALDYFFHIKDISTSGIPKIGDKVMFSQGQNRNGVCAIGIDIL